MDETRTAAGDHDALSSGGSLPATLAGVATRTGTLPGSEVRGLVDPEVRELLGTRVRFVDVPARALLDAAGRFDIGAKHSYLRRHAGGGPVAAWYRELYLDHVRVWNAFREADKRTAHDFLDGFHRLVASIEQHGFDPGRSVVAVNRAGQPLTGSHRIAACAHAGRSIRAVVVDHPGHDWGRDFFVRRGLRVAHADAVTFDHVRRDTSTRLVVIFPVAAGAAGRIREAFARCGDLVAVKQLRLRGFGPAMFVREIYRGEDWVGSSRDRFHGAQRRAAASFAGDEPLEVLVLANTSPADRLVEVKERMRDELGGGKETLHTSDSHTESCAVAGVVFNENSVAHLNAVRPRHLPRYESLLVDYEAWLSSRSGAVEHSDDVCLGGGAVMAAYGLRDCEDLDVVHRAERLELPDGIHSHNEHISRYGLDPHEVVDVPQRHFFSGGLKYLVLEGLRTLKAARDEGKDRVDLVAVERCLRGHRHDRRRVALLETRYRIGRRLRRIGRLSRVLVTDPRRFAGAVVERVAGWRRAGGEERR